MFREDVVNAYRNALKLYGVSEPMISKYTMAFMTGYDAAQMESDDEKEKFIKTLQYEEKVN